jgi:hypothetical protein
MPPSRYLSILPGTVVVEVLPPISTVGLGYEDREALRDETARRIRERLAAARQDSPSTHSPPHAASDE